MSQSAPRNIPPITPYDRLDALETEVRNLRADVDRLKGKETAALLQPGGGDRPLAPGEGAGSGTLHLPNKGRH